MDNTIITAVLLGLLTAMFLVIGNTLGGQTGMLIAFMFAAVTNFFSYWFSDSMILAAYRARRVGPNEAPQLYQIVQTLAQDAGLPMPKVYIVNSNAPNAFATGRNPSNASVAVTTGLMQILNPNELAGVMAHELAHIQHRDTLIGAIAATVAGAITMLADSARMMSMQPYPQDRSGRERTPTNLVVMILMIILAPIAALLIRMAISRSREYAADARGAQISAQPLALASALRKLDSVGRGTFFLPAELHPVTVHMLIINPLKSFTLANLFSTHPPIAERIRRLEAMHHYGTYR